jgi:hypothetical protein
VLGKSIRCRACRQVFYVPRRVGDSFIPPASGVGARAVQPPNVPAHRVLEGSSRECPACGRTVMVRVGLDVKEIRCPGCQSSFRAGSSAAEGTAHPTAMHASSLARPLPVVSHGAAASLQFANGRITSEPHGRGDGHEDLISDGVIGEECPPLAVGASSATGSTATAGALSTIIAILLGALCAFPVTQLILWWVFRQDPFRVAEYLPPSIRWVAPGTHGPSDTGP